MWISACETVVQGWQWPRSLQWVWEELWCSHRLSVRPCVRTSPSIGLQERWTLSGPAHRRQKLIQGLAAPWGCERGYSQAAPLNCCLGVPDSLSLRIPVVGAAYFIDHGKMWFVNKGTERSLGRTSGLCVQSHGAVRGWWSSRFGLRSQWVWRLKSKNFSRWVLHGLDLELNSWPFNICWNIGSLVPIKMWTAR